MCDPVSLTIAATAVAASGKMVSAVGQSKQFKYQAAVDQNNAARSNAQAQDSIENTKIEAQRRYREQSRTGGAQAAAMAANGVDLNFGSAADLQNDTAMIGAEDISQIYKGGNERTKGFEINAFNYKSSAVANKAKAKAAIVEGAFGAVSSVLGGASQVGGMKRPVN